MSISYKGNVQKQGNENNVSYQRISFAQYVQNQNRQFGKEISNVSTRHLPDVQPFKTFTMTRSKSQSVKFEHFRNKTLMDEEIQNQKPELVNPYVIEIYDYLKQNQFQFMCQQPFYMNHQQDITTQMRGILIDWLIDVHQKFKLVPETLFLCVNLIDRYLSKNTVIRSKLQLVGVASIFIASKYEEIYAPELKDFVYVCDHAYNKEEILEMESKILMTVQFNLTHTSALRFLERQISGANLCDKISNVAKMLLELSMLDVKCLKYPSSLQATTTILLAINLLKSPQVLPSSLHFVDNQEDLRLCLQDYLPIIQLLNNSTLTAIKRKYALEKYGKVSEIVQQILSQTQ